MAPFELLDPNGGPAPPGPWEARPAPAASFSAAAAPEEQAPLWRISLPADPAAAEAELRAAEAELRRQEEAVAGAPARLRALVARGRAASFSTAAPPAPEARVLALMDETPRAASFSASVVDDGELAAAHERFQAFVLQVQDAVGNFAVVETRRGQALIARTAVSWTGDLRLLVGAGLSAEENGMHRRSVNLALRSRAALLHTFAAVMRGAAIVALMASSPLGAARALPVAWRFVDDLLREERTRRQAASPA